MEGSINREIAKQAKLGINIKEVIVHAGQYYDTNMSYVFFEKVHITKPNNFLGIGGKTHGAMTG